MSQEQDRLFCKVAISSGKVSQENALKCLALANKLEAEGKQRPDVALIFRKNNLLSDDDVRLIYGALSRRAQGKSNGSAGARPAASPAGRTGVAGMGRPSVHPAHAGRPMRVDRSVRSTGHHRKEAIDPATLWLGVTGGLVVLVCVIVGLVVLLKNDEPPRPPDFVGGIMASSPKGASPVSAPSGPPAAAPKPAEAPAKTPPEASGPGVGSDAGSAPAASIPVPPPSAATPAAAPAPSAPPPASPPPATR